MRDYEYWVEQAGIHYDQMTRQTYDTRLLEKNRALFKSAMEMAKEMRKRAELAASRH